MTNNDFNSIGWGDDFGGEDRLPFPSLLIWALRGQPGFKGQQPDARYFGGWAYEHEKAAALVESKDLLTDPAWPVYNESGNGGDYKAAASRGVHVAVIKGRLRWFNSTTNEQSTKPFDGARSHVQYLCGLFVRRNEATTYAGMAVLTAKGLQADRLQRAITDWENAILAAAAGTEHAKLPRPAWIITLGTVGEAVFEEVGKRQKSKITPIKAIIPSKPELVLARVVPADVQNVLANNYAAALPWLNAWKSAKPSAAADPLPEPADMVDERPF